MSINVVFSVDENYIQHLGVALYSLLENNPDTRLNIYIMYSSLTEKSLKKIDKIASAYDCEINNIEINDDRFDNLVKAAHLTNASYFKLLVPELLDVDKVLYLDVDLVVVDSIQELYSTNIKEYYLAAVEDPGFNRHDKLKMDLSSHYFNAGVLLFNLKKMRDEDVSNRVITFIEKNPKAIKWADQCGLNSIIDGQWKMLHCKYNLVGTFFRIDQRHIKSCYCDSEIEEAKEKPIVIHYTGSFKPWHFMDNHPYRSLYWTFRDRTPFKRYFSERIFSIESIKRCVANFIRLVIFKKK